MQTAADFNQFYATSDPRRISRTGFRDKVLRRSISGFIAGNSVAYCQTLPLSWCGRPLGSGY